MRLVFLCGPPCSGKTTLAHTIAQPGDLIIDYDDIARDLGSPVQWQHPEPWRTRAEDQMQLAIQHAHHAEGGTAWVLRTAPRWTQRHRLAQQWHTQVYLLNPGEQACLTRTTTRPSGTRRAIGQWYHRYTPWSGDQDPSTLHEAWVNVPSIDRGMVDINPQDI